MILTPPQISELKNNINAALDRLYGPDISLIDRRANERSVVFRFGLYFSSQVNLQNFSQNNDLTFDFDYNRNGNDVKGMEGFNAKHGVYPDIILHRRGWNDKNVVVLEFKVHSDTVKGKKLNNQINRDKKKLIGFTSPNINNYQYGLGAFIYLKPERGDVAITYFINGQQQ